METPDWEDQNLYGDAPEDLPALEDIDDAEAARWARRLFYARERVARYDRMVAAEIDRIDAAREEALGPVEDRIEALELLLEGWHRAQFAAAPKTTPKTIKFPTGNPSKLADRPVTFDKSTADHDSLAAWLTFQDKTADGSRPLELIFPTPAEKSYKDKFKVSQLMKLCEWGPRGEPGEAVRLVFKATGEIVPGVRGIWDGQSWKGDGK